MGIARLTLAGIAHRLELDLEQTDDLKLAVTEACGILLERTPNGEPMILNFSLEADHVFRVTVGTQGHTNGTAPSLSDQEDHLGLFLIHALMDEVRMLDEGRTLSLSKDLSRRIDE